MNYTGDQLEFFLHLKDVNKNTSVVDLNYLMECWESVGVNSIESFIRYNLTTFIKESLGGQVYMDFDSMTIQELEDEANLIMQEFETMFGSSEYISVADFESMIEELMVEHSIEMPKALRMLAAQHGCLREDWSPDERAEMFCEVVGVPTFMRSTMARHLT